MSKRFLSGINVTGSAALNTVADAGSNTDKFLVLDSSNVVSYRTASELYADLGIGSLPAGYTSTLKHEVKAGQTISKGQAVYVSSADGTNMIVTKASNASEATSSKTMGLLETSLTTNGKGNVITEGLLSGLNTNGAVAGDPVWLGVDGALIFGLANKPVAPAHLVFIGIVTRANSNNGEIFVKVQNGFEMNELHNYAEGSVQNNQVIVYESATSLYKPKTIPTILGYTPVTNARTLTINGTTYDLSADRSWTISANLNARTEYEFTTDGSSATYNAVYSVGQVDVFYNGSKLSATEFTATNGTSVTLAFTPPNGQLVEIVAWETGGGVSNGRTLTINGTTYDLSANRSWTVTDSSKLPLSGGTLTGSLGIGISPSLPLYIKQVATDGYAFGIESSADDTKLVIGKRAAGFAISATYGSTGSYQSLSLYTSDSPRLTIATNGAATFSGSATFGSDVFTYANGGIFFNGGGSYGTGILQNSDGSINLQAGGAIKVKVFSTGRINFNVSESITTGNQDIWNFLAPNQTGGALSFNIGKSLSAYNNAALKFHYIGNNSSSNFLGIGFYDNDNILNIKANGNVGIKSSNPTSSLAFGASSYDSNPLAGLEYSQVSGGGRLDLKVQTWGSGSDYGLTTGLTLLTPGFDTKSLRVGIGTSSPTEVLHLNSLSTNAAFIRFQNTGGSGVYIGGRSDNMELYAGGSEKIKITSTGQTRFTYRNDSNEVMDLQLSTEVAQSKSKLSLLWYGNETASIKFVRGGDSTGGSLEFWTQKEIGSYAERLKITSSGAAIFSISGDNYLSIDKAHRPATPQYYGGMKFTGNGYEWGRIETIQSNPSASWYSRMAFYTMRGGGGAVEETMALTSEGAVLVGSTSSAWATTNRAVFEVGGSGFTNALIGLKYGSTTGGYLFHNGTDMYLNQDQTNRLYVIANNGGVYLTSGSTSWTANSDERLKNINSNIDNAVNKLMTLRAINFSWKSDCNNKEILGLIAQDVEKVFPQVIDKGKLPNSPSNPNEDETEYLGVRYQELVPVLVKAIQEQQAQIEELKSRLN